LGEYALLLNGSKIDMTNNNNDSLWEGRARRLERNFGERTLPDTFVSDGRLRQIYDPRSNDENQLSSLRPPAGYTSSNIVPQGNGDPYSPSVSSNYLPKSRMFPPTIVHQNERIKHQPHIVAPQHEVSVPLSPLNFSHSKRCHPYHSSYPHQRSSLFHHSNQSIRLRNDELGLSSLSESFTSNDQDTTSHSIFNATPVTVKSGQMNQTIHPVSKNEGNISFCMSSDNLVCNATLVLS